MLPPAQSTAASFAMRTGRSSIWMMSVGTTPWTHHRAADIGDGDQDRANGHPDPDLTFRLYRLGRRSRPPSRAHPDRPRQGKTVRSACRQRAHRVRQRYPGRSGRASALGSQGEPRGRGRGVKIVGLLLAGGQSRRMGGGDKALRLLGEIPLLDRVIERLRPQVDALVLNANGDPARFAGYALPIVPDS